MKSILSILFVLLSTTLISQECQKCDIEKLLNFHHKLDNIDYQTAYEFICTFDSACSKNAEFSEWSNELLFKFIKTNVNLLNKVLHDLGYNYVILISEELKSPVQEINVQEIYNIVKNSTGPKDMQLEEKNALRKLAEKEGIELKE